MKLLIAALLTAASLSICAAPSVIAGDKPVSPTKPIVKNPLAEADRQLKAAEAKWKKKRPEHYSYTLQRSCFCAPDYRKPIEIRVFRGKVQQASLLPEGTPLPAERKAEALPVEGLFRMIREAIVNKSASVTVKYNATYGYPTSISIDRDRMMADEEVYLFASNFKIASGLKPKQQK